MTLVFYVGFRGNIIWQWNHPILPILTNLMELKISTKQVCDVVDPWLHIGCNQIWYQSRIFIMKLIWVVFVSLLIVYNHTIFLGHYFCVGDTSTLKDCFPGQSTFCWIKLSSFTTGPWTIWYILRQWRRVTFYIFPYVSGPLQYVCEMPLIMLWLLCQQYYFHQDVPFIRLWMFCTEPPCVAFLYSAAMIWYYRCVLS